ENVKSKMRVYASRGKWQRVLENIHTKNETRPCYEIFYNRRMQLTATEDHPFLVARLWYKGKSVSKRIKEIKWMKAGELYKLSARKHGLEAFKFIIPRTPDQSFGTREEGLIVGFTLGDGYFPKNRRRIVLYFNSQKEGRLARYYEHILQDLGYKVWLERIRQNSNFWKKRGLTEKPANLGGTLSVAFIAPKIKQRVLELKKNPFAIFSYSKVFAEGVYQGLLDSDGYKNQITQKKKRL
ncbi:unnamed protein product, partial [marine sediment metagenome]